MHTSNLVFISLIDTVVSSYSFCNISINRVAPVHIRNTRKRKSLGTWSYAAVKSTYTAIKRATIFLDHHLYNKYSIWCRSIFTEPICTSYVDLNQLMMIFASNLTHVHSSRETMIVCSHIIQSLFEQTREVGMKPCGWDHNTHPDQHQDGKDRINHYHCTSALRFSTCQF